MILKSACAFSHTNSETDFAILIVSRLTQNDGKTRDPYLCEIAQRYEDCWRPELAPRPKTVGAWYRKEINWQEFSDQYLTYLKSETGQVATSKLYETIKQKKVVTVLCVEDTCDHCHRSLLLDFMEKKYPDIEITKDVSDCKPQ
ncbi:MAG: hypothetical protein QG609_86 [Patescibacteria group bacterium]|nr:hypothetical protein [Patescibacteria group bacterium]